MMSKQEFQLFERIAKALEKIAEQLDNGIVIKR